MEFNSRCCRNYWFRWFAIAFSIGASIPPAILASQKLFPNGPTTMITDLRVSVGKVEFTGNAAWGAAAISCGIFSGLVGLIAAALNRLDRRLSR